MRILPSAKTIRRAQARQARRFLAAMGLLTLAFAVVVAGHYLLGWW